MKLPTLPFGKKKIKPNYFLAFILRDEKAIAVVIEEIEGKLKTVGQAQQTFEKSVDEVSDEDFLDTADKIISQAEASLPPNVETQKTIFGLKDSWVEDNKIKKEHLEKLKKISEQLGLTPIGFLVNSEAIVNLLQKEEGAPLTAIVADVGKNEVTVSLIKAGRILETKGSEIHDTVAFTVDTLLKHFQIPEILPSKVVIHSTNDKDLSQQFISHQWSKSLPFLHLPQVIALSKDFNINAIIFGAAKQLGLEIMPEFMRRDRLEEEIVEEKPIVEEKKEPKETTEEETLEDAVKKEEEESEKREEITSEETAVNIEEKGMEEFGFVEGKDVAKTEIVEKEDAKTEETLEKEDIKEVEEEPRHAIEEEQEKEVSPRSKPLTGFFLMATLGLKKLFGKTSLLHLPKIGPNFARSKLFIFPVIVIVLIGVGYFLYITSAKATVSLTLKPEIEEEEADATFSSSGKTDVENNIIAGDFISVSESGSVSINASGKKETGTEAKGTIVLYSRFTSEKTIASGTVVESSNGLKFETTSSVKVASASADASAEPTTAKVEVIAQDIGKESNLPAGTKFSIGTFSTGDIIAKNDDPFSGGSKKEITIFSDDDAVKLEESLIEKLEDDAHKDLEKEVGGDKISLPVFIDTTISKEKYSKEVGDEAEQVSLSANVEYKAIVYAKSDLSSFAESLLKNKVSEEMEIDSSNIKVEVSEAEKKNTEQVNAKLVIQAPVLPSIKEDDLVNKLAGKNLRDARELILQIPQVYNVEIKIFPHIPFITNSLPGSSSNIKIISSNE